MSKPYLGHCRCMGKIRPYNQAPPTPPHPRISTHMHRCKSGTLTSFHANSKDTCHLDFFPTFHRFDVMRQTPDYGRKISHWQTCTQHHTFTEYGLGVPMTLWIVFSHTLNSCWGQRETELNTCSLLRIWFTVWQDLQSPGGPQSPQLPWRMGL